MALRQVLDGLAPVIKELVATMIAAATTPLVERNQQLETRVAQLESQIVEVKQREYQGVWDGQKDTAGASRDVQ